MANLTDQEKTARVGLALTEGLGPASARRLIDRFGSAEAVLATDPVWLKSEAGLKAEAIDLLPRALDTARQELDRLAGLGGFCLVWGEEGYPAALAEIPQPPMALFGLGGFTSADGRALAIVGSRAATVYGCRVTQDMAQDLAGLGVTVVSGLAKGIDSAAHQGALKGGGRTVAVLGCGLDVDYPRDSRKLKERIADSGAVVTEYPLGTQPAPWHFPVRNRIIAGLSRGVVVAEAASGKSGSIITARLAGEFGRTVMAVPGPITDNRRQGAHQLIREGAVLVTSGAEAAIEMWPEVTAGKRFLIEPEQKIDDLGLDEASRRVYRLVEHAPRHADEIIRQAGLEASEAQGALLNLELTGLVARLPGQMFVRR